MAAPRKKYKNRNVEALKSACCVDGCNKKRATRGRYCWHHRYERSKETDPIGVAYYKLRANALRRGKPFEITRQDFAEFCVKTPYMVGKGRHADSYHVDRIDESKGYVKGNLQILTNRENVRKYGVFTYHRGKCLEAATVLRYDTPQDLQTDLDGNPLPF
jgi:hypothetical protein